MQLDLFTSPKREGFKLRPYQSEAVEAVYREWETETLSTLVVKATGLGKTVLLSEVCRRWPEDSGRILVLAHRSELIDQAASKIERHTGVTPEIEMAELRAGTSDRSSPIVVSSIQSQNAGKKCWCRSQGMKSCDECIDGIQRRMQRFDSSQFGLVIIDEGHHATAKTYRRILEYYAPCKVLLVTATPKRTDEVGLCNVCETVAFEMGISDAISEGWLVPIKQKFVRINGLDFSNVSTKAGGDLADGQLERAMRGTEGGGAIEEDSPVHEIVSATIQESHGEPTLVFGSGKEHVKDLARIFNRHDGVKAKFVIDGTPKDERKETVKWFRDAIGRDVDGYQAVLIGCGVFTEGFDADNIRWIANGRPTKSESLYTQMVGRGTRPLDGTVDGEGLETSEARIESIANSEKPHVTVLDFVGNSGRHKLVSTADVLDGNALPEDVEAAMISMEKSGEECDIRDAIERAKQDREESEKRQREREERERLEALEEERKRHLRGVADYETEDVDIFGYSGGNPDRVVVRRGATDGQVDFLERLGVSRETALGFTKTQAGAVITKQLNKTGPDFVMRFGKHSGKPLSEVPKGYLQWAIDKGAGDKDFRKNAREAMNWNPPQKNSDPPQKPVEDIDREYASIVGGEKVPF